jgi:hypothetical protein
MPPAILPTAGRMNALADCFDSTSRSRTAAASRKRPIRSRLHHHDVMQILIAADISDGYRKVFKALNP